MSEATTPDVAIFWDYEACSPPSNFSGHKLVDNIRRLTQTSGPIKLFKAYFDVSPECADPRSLTLHSELQSSGVTLVHCPRNGKKGITDRIMIVDMFSFVLDNSAPRTIAIITGHRDFSYAAAVLRLRGYKVVLISHNVGRTNLAMQADILFDWQKNVIDQVSREDTDRDSFCSVNSQKPSVPTDVTESGDGLHQRIREVSIPQYLLKSKFCIPSETLPSVPTEASKSSSPRVDEKPDSELQTDNEAQTRQVFHAVISTPEKAAHGTASCAKDDTFCFCKICTRKSGPILDANKMTVCQPVQGESTVHGKTGGASPLSGVQAQNRTLVENVLSVDNGSSTDTPSSVSSDPQVTAASSSPSISTKEQQLPSASVVRQFRVLVEFFYEQWTRSGCTRIHSSTVAWELLKRDPDILENGVSDIKQYIEEARLANVVVSTTPSRYSQEEFWIEINVDLLRMFKLWGLDGLLGTKPPLEWEIVEDSSPEKVAATVDPVFEPLVERLRMEYPSCRMLFSRLGSYIKAEHPYIYEIVGIQTLSQYLRKAEEQGIVRLGDIYSPGRQWAELVPDLRVPHPISVSSGWD